MLILTMELSKLTLVQAHFLLDELFYYIDDNRVFDISACLVLRCYTFCTYTITSSAVLTTAPVGFFKYCSLS